MRAFTDPREDWLTVVRLPGHAPDLNTVEGARPVMKSGLGNHAASTPNQLEALVRSRLRAIQRRPDLINALLSRTEVTLDPPPQTLNSITVVRKSTSYERRTRRSASCELA
jgi:hypothetical protein